MRVLRRHKNPEILVCDTFVVRIVSMFVVMVVVVVVVDPDFVDDGVV